ncbi:MAG TPA: serine hydrolase [Candidatus Angelobacter sp.]|nr:serine hydrolase [Candidatus Angelobacter sp.]
MPKRTFHRALSLIVFALVDYASSAQTPAGRLQKVVQPYVDAQMFMGSVLVAKDGKAIFSKSYGMADLEWSVPNSPTTRFNIASMTKQFTAASILLLEDRGKLRTDDLAKKYLPDAPTAWDKITIYHLLTHTSGIPDDAAKYEPGTPDKLIFHDKPLNFEPGTRWAYTNLGYIVLGYLLERISGQTYEEFVQQNIFKPLGMNDSGLMSFVTIIPRRASGYWPGSNGIENADRPDARIGFSAGSLYSTTEDLLQWEEGLFGGKILSPASLRKMTTPFKSDYACGLHVSRINGRLLVEHDGNNIGFNADMAYYPEERIAVIVLANLNGTVTGEMTKALAAVAHGEPPPIPSVHREIPLSKEVLARYAGTYQFPHYSLKMVPEGNHLLVEFDNGGTIPVFPESETKFFSKPWPEQFEFSKDDKGEYTVLTRHRGDKETHGAKK